MMTSCLVLVSHFIFDRVDISDLYDLCLLHAAFDALKKEGLRG